jgi:trk system potassium uptake protein TrkH
VTLCRSYLVLPLVLAIPMEQAVSATRFINVYLDMVSALTTTGAVVFEADRLPPRCICGARRWAGSGGF